MIAMTLDRVIRSMCAEIESPAANLDWQTLREEELLCEAVVCIVGSQMIYEMALEVVQRLKSRELITPWVLPNGAWRRGVALALNRPLRFMVGGQPRVSKMRFRNRIAHLLTGTLRNVYGQHSSFRSILNYANGAEDARRVLVARVFGFGPKQASLFLRRIGYATNLAVIDTHILDYMRICAGISASRATLSSIDGYEQIEEKFKLLAQRIGYDVGCVDLATWITMRVAKREAYI
jgi:N-glycosylase/DNA lyase